MTAMPAAPGLPRMMRLARTVRENHRTVSLELDGDLEAAPGQFCMLWLPGMDEKPFSVSGARPARFTVNRVGPFSEALHALAPGSLLGVRGPFGVGWSAGPARVLLAGGGYGAAPLAFLAERLRAAGCRVEAALGARTAADLLFVDRLEALGAAVHVATEDGSAGARGRVTDVVAPLLAAGGFQRLCACGPEPMLEALSRLCGHYRLPAELSHEAYLRCGVGLCGACEHGGRLVCLDGPVFTAAAAAADPAEAGA
jgi:dihydroorotate dehydrogenase electron transfer subunit